jgi:hypothetical protein
MGCQALDRLRVDFGFKWRCQQKRVPPVGRNDKATKGLDSDVRVGSTTVVAVATQNALLRNSRRFF